MVPLSPKFAERLHWMETESRYARICPDLDEEFPMQTFTFPTMDPDPRDPGMPLVYRYLDNTTLQTAMHCWRHYWYSSVLGLRRGRAEAQPVRESVHLTFGTLIHEGADVWCKLVANGLEPERATLEAVAYVLNASWPEGAAEDVFGGRYAEVWQCSDRTKTNSKKGIKRCEWSYKEHLLGDGVTPSRFVKVDWICECGRKAEHRVAYLCDERYKNRRTLARAMVALCDHFTASDLKVAKHADGRVASELRWFQPLNVQDSAGGPILMTGSLDSVATDAAGRHIVRELKTTRRQPDEKFWSSYEMSPQVHTYTWGAVREFGPGTQVHIIAIQIGIGFVEIYAKPVYLNPESLAEWQGEMEHYVGEMQLRAHLAAQEAAQGRDPIHAYPRRLSACGGLPGASTTPCPFRDFCRLSPGDRQSFLEGNFRQEPWNPIGVKGAEVTAADEDA